MLKIIKKYKKLLISVSFVYIYLLIILLAPSKHVAITPGEINNVDDMYVIEGIDFDSNFNVVSVYSWQEISVFQKWLINNNSRFDLRPQSDYEQTLSRMELNLQGRISNDSSHNNAVITAYEHANMKDNSIKINYNLSSLTVYATNNLELNIGDEIVKINNTTINDKSYQTYLEKFDLYNETSNNRFNAKGLSLTILRNEEELTINVLNDDVVIFYPKYEIVSTTPNYEGLREKINRGGPSGGMIQALAIYSSLLNINYDENLKVAGTGTIDTNLDFTVGRIGGIVQKYYTVKDNKIDVFIIPTSHYSEIRDIIKENDKVNVVTVDDFSDLITKFTLKYGDLND